MTEAPFEVYALRYASRPDNTAGASFYRHQIYGEPDGAIGMDYFIWLVRRGSEVVLIDCGFDQERGRARNREWTTPPVELLARVGVRPDDIGTVVLTHLHFDHSGNIDLFPKARFVMSQVEFDYWTGPYGDRVAVHWPSEQHEVGQVKALHAEGRLELTADEHTILPGLRVRTLPGHTPGQLITEVDVGEGTVVLTSDAMHYYDEIDLDRPFYIYDDLRSILRSYEVLRELEAQPGTVLVPGHDPAVMTQFPEVAPECLDLTRAPRPGRRPGAAALTSGRG